MNPAPPASVLAPQAGVAFEQNTLPSLRTASNPRTWTVAEVIRRLCKSRDLFKESGIAADMIPDQQRLEHDIWHKQITGEALLTSIHRSSVSSELSLHDQDEQEALITVINRLWRHAKFCDEQGVPPSVGSPSLQDPALRTPPQASQASQHPDRTGPKRQKLTHVTTVPVSTAQPPSAFTEVVQNPFSYAQFQATPPKWDHLLRWENEEGGDEEIPLDERYSEDEMEDESLDGRHLEESEADESEAGESEARGSEAEEIDTGDERPDMEERLLTSTALKLKSRNLYPECHKLNPDEISQVINHYIEEYTSSWENDLENRKSDPEKLWNEAESANRRLEYVQKYRADLDHLNELLNHYCDEGVQGTGAQLQSVLEQCRNLEGTLDNLLMAEWLLSIYQLEPECSDAESVGAGSDTSTRLQSRLQVPQLADTGSSNSDTTSTRTTGQNENMSEMHGTTRGGAYPPMLFAVVEQTPVAPVEPAGTSSQRNSRTAIRPSQVTWVAKHQASGKPPILGDQPHTASMQTVQKWKWTHLVQSRDRKRVVSKAILELRIQDREAIRGELTRDKEQMFQDLLKVHTPTNSVFAKLFLCWWTCSNCFQKMPSQEQLNELQNCIWDGCRDPLVFVDYVDTIFHTTFSREALEHPERPSQSEVIEISDDEEVSLPVSRARPEKAGKIRPNRPRKADMQEDEKAPPSVASTRAKSRPKADDVVIVID